MTSACRSVLSYVQQFIRWGHNSGTVWLYGWGDRLAFPLCLVKCRHSSPRNKGTEFVKWSANCWSAVLKHWNFLADPAKMKLYSESLFWGFVCLFVFFLSPHSPFSLVKRSIQCGENMVESACEYSDTQCTAKIHTVSVHPQWTTCFCVM